MKGKKYLRKIKTKEMTISQVAILLEIEEEEVKKAYVDYVNPFNKNSRKFLNMFFSMIAIIISVIGVIIANNANRSMEIERKLEYSPVIELNSDIIRVVWDSEGSCNKLSYSKYGSYDQFDDMSFVYLALANIGRGTAHNIFYEWDNEYNLEMLISGLEIDAVEKNEDGSWSIRKDDGEFYLYGVSEDGISGNISFLYPESEKSLRMPFEYVSLLTFNIYKQVTDEFSDMTYTNALNSISFPEFKLKVDYEDLTSSTTLEENQGMFSLKERFSFEATYYSVNEDGSGYCDLMIKELD